MDPEVLETLLTACLPERCLVWLQNHTRVERQPMISANMAPGGALRFCLIVDGSWTAPNGITLGGAALTAARLDRALNHLPKELVTPVMIDKAIQHAAARIHCYPGINNWGEGALDARIAGGSRDSEATPQNLVSRYAQMATRGGV